MRHAELPKQSLIADTLKRILEWPIDLAKGDVAVGTKFDDWLAERRGDAW